MFVNLMYHRANGTVGSYYSDEKLVGYFRWTLSRQSDRDQSPEVQTVKPAAISPNQSVETWKSCSRNICEKHILWRVVV